MLTKGFAGLGFLISSIGLFSISISSLPFVSAYVFSLLIFITLLLTITSLVILFESTVFG
tara:strand:+ start:424 stop:603 length:180 start_codon:yes stop_codon:yes gene_type:complete